jgi:RNA polymerase sigma-70 factor (ECF subfamily)
MEHTSSASTSSSLIRQVQANDPNAWTRLSQLYAPLAYGWCRQAGLQNADIADIVQNVFTAVHKGIASFRHDRTNDSFRGWLWTITRNEVRMHYRRRASQPQATGGTDAYQAIEQVPDIFEKESHTTDSLEERHFIHRALRMIQAEFEPATWQAFWRTTVNGRSAPDVAEELGMNPGAVRQAKHRVLVRLREFLTDDYSSSDH